MSETVIYKRMYTIEYPQLLCYTISEVDPGAGLFHEPGLLPVAVL